MRTSNWIYKYDFCGQIVYFGDLYIYISLCDRNDVVVFCLRNSIWTSFKNDFDIFSISDWIWNEESLTIIKMISINYIHSYTVRLPPSPSPLMVTWFGTRPKYTQTNIHTHPSYTHRCSHHHIHTHTVRQIEPQCDWCSPLKRYCDLMWKLMMGSCRLPNWKRSMSWKCVCVLGLVI